MKISTLFYQPVLKACMSLALDMPHVPTFITDCIVNQKGERTDYYQNILCESLRCFHS